MQAQLQKDKEAAVAGERRAAVGAAATEERVAGMERLLKVHTLGGSWLGSARGRLLALCCAVLVLNSHPAPAR